ncbi:MAG: amino acid permease [Sulfobacillus benefaciens]|uniref:Amino acid permease n=1 Tax=Sulfobacillus benefaciens TaxID=453960 RepID=A0A2T2XDY7_9FIRM|nr:MAG: amino acid permease [Sulfobacillus benefaciens]
MDNELLVSDVEGLSDLSEDQVVELFHYRQEFKRTLTGFGSFATSYSFISVTTGIFTMFGYVMATGGPAGIWVWPIAALGQLMVAFLYSDIAGRIPISGYSYQWITRIANPAVGWFAGWLGFAYFMLVVAAVNAGLSPVIAVIFGISPSTRNLIVIGVVLIILQFLINAFNTRIASLFNNFGVFTELIGLVLLGVLLLIVGLSHGHPVSTLFQHPNVKGAFFPAFIASFLFPLYTIVGFETAANMAEETHNAHRTVPKTVILSVVSAGIVGMFFLIAAVMGMPSLHGVLKSATPLPYIVDSNLGSTIGTVFLVVVAISIFVCGLVCMMSGARLVYAMSRDNRFFMSTTFRYVSKRFDTPFPALVLLTAIGIVVTLFSNSLAILVGTTAVMPTLTYLLTILAYFVAVRRGNLPDSLGGFSLGRWATPVGILAVLWLVIGLLILTVPKEFHAIDLWSLGIFLIGGLIYLFGFRKTTESTL